MKRNKHEDFDFEEIKKKALEQVRSGKSAYGEDGAFTPILKNLLESALKDQLDAHLYEDEPMPDNHKNGETANEISTPAGIKPAANGNYKARKPERPKKREALTSRVLESMVLNLYGSGMSFQDIRTSLNEEYDENITDDTLTAIIDRITPALKEWLAHPLEPIYCIVWLDALNFRIKENGKIVSRVMHNIMGINIEGHKKLLGLYVSEVADTHFWTNVFSDLSRRGVEDILIACVDKLTEIKDAIQVTFPKTAVQSCIVHQTRNSLKYIAGNDRKDFYKDLKAIYRSTTQDLAEQKLAILDKKWGKKYPLITNSWRNNWSKLSTYLKYDPFIQKLICTGHPIDVFHRQFSKIIMTKGVFVSDMDMLKLIYAAYIDIRKTWTHPLRHWSVTIAQLSFCFEGRLKLEL